MLIPEKATRSAKMELRQLQIALIRRWLSLTSMQTNLFLLSSVRPLGGLSSWATTLTSTSPSRQQRRVAGYHNLSLSFAPGNRHIAEPTTANGYKIDGRWSRALKHLRPLVNTLLSSSAAHCRPTLHIPLLRIIGRLSKRRMYTTPSRVVVQKDQLGVRHIGSSEAPRAVTARKGSIFSGRPRGGTLARPIQKL